MTPRPALERTLSTRLASDPRHYQIFVLGTLLVYGLSVLDFPLSLSFCLTVVGMALVTQAIFCRWIGLPIDFRSPLISSLSLCLLLRTQHLEIAGLAAFLAVASKFLLRSGGRHLFNPTAFALLAMISLTDHAWVSPGQWGEPALAAFFTACLGGVVVGRAARSDVTFAFLASYAAVVSGRAAWLGDPLAIPVHQLTSGSFVLFAFFMISDPKTTPSSRAGRIVFAAWVALAAGAVHFLLFRPNGFLYALVAGALTLPLIDRLLPGERYRWPGSRPAAKQPDRSMIQPTIAPHPIPCAIPPRRPTMSTKQTRSSSPTRSALARRALLVLFALALLVPHAAQAFCGFYVGRAGSKLFNKASQVVLVRDGDRTVVTMASDFRGELSEFALVVPVPTVLEREQIHVADMALIDHLDAYTAPRLVEYFDQDPCRRLEMRKLRAQSIPEPASADADLEEAARREGVIIEASYTVGEYDILILSAEESHGLTRWLKSNGYRLPDGAEPVLASYLKQGMRFFVAKVNLEEQAELGTQLLRPLQVAYETPKFMLPIRLGTVNANGPQELFVYALTRTGRVETTNYRTVRLPTGMELPELVEDDFADFYRDMFRRQVERERMRAVFLEYAWDMGWCDPCAADPLSPRELRELGVFWIDEPEPTLAPRRRPVPSGGQNVFVTRLHLRYDRDRFPEDLVFQTTGDRTNFQGRFVIRHPWRGDAQCRLADEYRRSLPARFEREAQELASLTGWPIEEIRRRMELDGPIDEPEPWWKRIWKSDG